MEQFKCPSCGGSVEFDIGTQQLKCPYCDSEFDINALQEKEERKNTKKPDVLTWEGNAGQEWNDGETDGMVVYACKSCGGEIVGDENLGATTCPYCGNQTVIKEKFSGNLKPDYVIPFKKDKKAAKQAFEEFISSSKYVPRSFKSEKHIDEIKGIYVPFWVFDADVDASVSYDAEKVRTWISGDYQTTETTSYDICREGNVVFSNVPVDGASKIADDMMESIEPFDFSEAVEFQTAYLSGFYADKYDVDEEGSKGRAQERIKQSVEDSFRATISSKYDVVIPYYSHVNMKSGKAKYALYPVWMLSATYKGKPYTFAMNGQTGKFAGDLPIDDGALWKYYGKCTLITGAIIYALSVLLMIM